MRLIDADALKEALGMKGLSLEEAIAILSDMKIDIPVPKAAVTQRTRNAALDMAISALSCSEIPNSLDYIRRQAAIDAADRIIKRDTSGNNDVVKAMTAWKEYIAGLPAVDAVPVIRCRDCKWYKTAYSWNGNEHKICVIEPYVPVRKDDDFCSRGERREK